MNTKWKLVPVEPTAEMLQAFDVALNVWIREIGEDEDVWKAMLEASPQPAQEPRGWVCGKCGTDRLKAPCPHGHHAALTGQCPMVGTAQGASPQPQPAKRCAQCQSQYRQGTAAGCPKCAPGVVVSEDEFRRPLAEPQPAPLTDEQRMALFVELNSPCVKADSPSEMFTIIVRAIERAHGIGGKA